MNYKFPNCTCNTTGGLGSCNYHNELLNKHIQTLPKTNSFESWLAFWWGTNIPNKEATLFTIEDLRKAFEAGKSI